jgi:pantoate--beta-alanine ligase
MDIIRSPAAMTAWSNRKITERRTIALVPTMGSFHDGHLSLMRLTARQADCVVVSLFVNPFQFGPAEDLEQYPRDFERDAALAAQEKIDVLFAPTVEDMYPAGYQTRVMVSELSRGLCGAERPGHFEGVTTVVAKLFNIIRPQLSVFGEKDYQQLTIIRQMVEDLNWNVDIIGHPIIREPDGLAMSSRNAYLSPEEREKARCLSQAIKHARSIISAGQTDVGLLEAEIESLLASSDPAVQVEYIHIVDQNSLKPQSQIDRNSLLTMAVKIGRTRLIDNGRLF